MKLTRLLSVFLPQQREALALPSPEQQALQDLILKSGLFDPDYYLDRYPEIRSFRPGALAHFSQYGIYEHRDPGPNFSTRLYLEKYPERGKLPIPPFLQITRGELQSERQVWLSRDRNSFVYLLKQSGLFDKDWYLKQNTDVSRAGLDPFNHLIDSGAREGRDPGPNFQTDFYVEQNPDFVALGVSPLEHYLRVGRAAGASATGPSRYTRWLARCDSLTAADREQIILAANDLPPIVCLHVVTDEKSNVAVPDLFAVQIGVVPQIRRIADGATNEGLLTPAHALNGLQDGTILVLAGDLVRFQPHAAYLFGKAVTQFEATAAYSDHDHITAEGTRSRPIFKPKMSPEFMKRVPYAGPAISIRLSAQNRVRITKALVEAADGEPAAAWASLLCDMSSNIVARIPFLLYSLLGEAAPSDLGEQATDRSYEPRLLNPAQEQPVPKPLDPPQVCILIPTRDRHELLRACIDSIFENTDYPRACFRVIVIDNDTQEPESRRYLDALAVRPGCTVVSAPGAFNFAKICNVGASAADGAVLVFLNNDMTVREADWLLALVTQAMRPEIGVVGAQLLYPDNTVQHGGVILGLQGIAGHRLVGVRAEKAAHHDVTREMTAVTGACLALRRSLFEELGGFDETLSVAFNDTVLCIRAFTAGYRNIYLARPLLYHHESKSRGLDDSREKLVRNRREATYTREHYGALFQDDPSYNPNLSLDKAGSLAMPPRAIRPWRRLGGSRRLLLLSQVHGFGDGVAGVVGQQAEYFKRHGWEVTVGGPISKRDRIYPGCRRTALWNAPEAAAYAFTESIDCIVAHTPPFFSITRYFGRTPLVYMFDHGEPPPTLFSDWMAREDVDWDKRFCAPMMRRVFTISQAIYDQQFRRDAHVLRNGNSHLAIWSSDWAERRASLRRKYGFEGRYVVLNVCRFGKEERRYKGVEAYIALTRDLPYSVSGLGQNAIFALAGRGDPEDVAYATAAGLTVLANVTDAEMAELYAASDLYVSLSQWEGYNLGIGQALAMGLDVVASDIPAHREFGVPTGDATAKLCRLVGDAYNAWDEDAMHRTARVESWDVPLKRMAELLEADCADEATRPWY